jgi:hypothetical protein
MKAGLRSDTVEVGLWDSRTPCESIVIEHLWMQQALKKTTRSVRLEQDSSIGEWWCRAAIFGNPGYHNDDGGLWVHPLAFHNEQCKTWRIFANRVDQHMRDALVVHTGQTW